MDENINFEDLIGIDGYVKTMDKWIKERPTISTLITGPSGSGKTTFVMKYLKKNGYNIHLYNSSNFQKQKKIIDILYQTFQNNNIQQFFLKNFKTAVVIDELEGISINDKGCISEIIEFLKILEKYKLNKTKQKISSSYFNIDILFICIGQNSYIKKLKDLEKICFHINIESPNDKILEQAINKYNPNISDDDKKEIIKWSEGDFRKLKQFLSGQNWKESKIKYYNLNTITKNLLYKQEPINALIRHYNNEKILLPLMMHQNYKNTIFNVTKDKYALHCHNISDIISNSDTIGSYIFHHNEWDIGAFYAISSCYKISNYIQSIDHNKNSKEHDILFTKLLNRTSLQCTYKHTYNNNVAKYNNYFVDKDIVKFNINKIKCLLKNDPQKYDYLLSVNKIDDSKLLTKLEKCI